MGRIVNTPAVNGKKSQLDGGNDLMVILIHTHGFRYKKFAT